MLRKIFEIGESSVVHGEYVVPGLATSCHGALISNQGDKNNTRKISTSRGSNTSGNRTCSEGSGISGAADLAGRGTTCAEPESEGGSARVCGSSMLEEPQVLVLTDKIKRGRTPAK